MEKRVFGWILNLPSFLLILTRNLAKTLQSVVIQRLIGVVKQLEKS